MLSKEAIDEFKELYKEEFGEAISDEDALKRAINLLTFMNVIYRPLEKEWLKESEEKDKK